jgi:hypothetical protein
MRTKRTTMKKILLVPLALALASPVWAARQEITDITTQQSRKDLREAMNLRLNAIDDNTIELYAADLLKANISCFADASAFNGCFALDWPTLVTRDSLGLDTDDNPYFNSINTSGNIAANNMQVTKPWFTGLSYTADVTSVIHGGQHYIAKTTHTAGSTTEPGAGASWETAWAIASGSGGSFDEAGDYTVTGDWDFTGATVTGLPGAAQVWPAAGGVAVYGGSSAWGTSLVADGDAIGELVVVHDDGEGNAVLPFSISYNDLLDKPTISEGSGLPEGGATDQIIVKTESGYDWIDFKDHPQFATLLSAFNAAGLNSFTFELGLIGQLHEGTYYQSSVPFPVSATVTDSNESYTIANVYTNWDGAGYGENTMTYSEGSGIWERTGFTGTAGPHTLQLRAVDNKAGTPNSGESAVYNIIIDLTDPVIDLTVGLEAE